MRFLCWHVDYFRAKPAGKGRSTVIEEGKEIDVEKSAMLLFISFEKSDEPAAEDVLDRAVGEIGSIAAQLNEHTIILNPFAHLFGELSSPQFGAEMIEKLAERLKDRKFEVYRLSFGIFYEIELKAKGHKLARMSRKIG